MSQCSRVLDVLRDGKPHSIQEIHEKAGTMRLNSRISDLRKFGYFIVYYRKDGLHTYQLLSELETMRAGTGDDAAAADSSLLGPSSLSPAVQPHRSGALPVAGPTSRNDPQSERAARQLSVFEAA